MAAPGTDQSDSHPRPTTWAALDCGTNTLLLTIVTVGEDGVLRPLCERAELTRLGEGLVASGVLHEAAVQRTVAALRRHVEAIERLGCTRVLAVATEALRRAANGAEVRARLDALLAPLGARLEIIDGGREAALAFLAARHAFPALSGPRTVVDIGGGSTELVVGASEVASAVSLPIGSVVLSERYLATDPPRLDELAALRREIDHALVAAPRLEPTVIGLAATVTTLAAIGAGVDEGDVAAVEGASVGRAWLERELTRLAALPLGERRRVRGLKAERADLIVAGGHILLAVLERAGAPACLVSDRGVRWGLLYDACGGRLRP